MADCNYVKCHSPNLLLTQSTFKVFRHPQLGSTGTKMSVCDQGRKTFELLKMTASTLPSSQAGDQLNVKYSNITYPQRALGQISTFVASRNEGKTTLTWAGIREITGVVNQSLSFLRTPWSTAGRFVCRSCSMNASIVVRRVFRALGAQRWWYILPLLTSISRLMLWHRSDNGKANSYSPYSYHSGS